MNFISDIPTILQWYVPITLMGIIFLPLTSRIFSSFYDRGYIFSKILGILLISYSVWLVGSLRIMPFNSQTIVIVLIGWAVVIIFIVIPDLIRYKANKDSRFRGNDRVDRINKFRIPTKLILFEELFFLAGLLFWSYIRGHEPSIHGLEKFMDFGFINSILNTSYFPPQDMWLAPRVTEGLAPAQNPEQSGLVPSAVEGFFINYYYFGHYLTALLTKLTRLPSSITYNLMLSTIFAFCLTGSFSIGFNLFARVKKQFSRFNALVSGLLTALLVTLAGNLHTIYILTRGYENEHPVPFWRIFGISNQINYWYPNATRFIPNTIHEFPSYSWVVADLHGHVLDIPFVLLTIAVLLAIFLKFQVSNSNFQTISKPQFLNSKQNSLNINNLKFVWNLIIGNWEFLLLGLLTAVMYMTNAWDGLIYLGLSLLVISTIHFIQPFRSSFPQFSIFNFQFSKPKQNSKYKKNNLEFARLPARQGYWNLIGIWILIIGSFAVFSFPFNRYFVPFVHGIGVVGGYEMGQALGLIKGEAASVVNIGPFLLEKGNNLSSPLWMLGVLWGFFYFNILLLFLSMYMRIKHRTNSNLTNIRVHSNIIRVIRELEPSTLFLLALIIVSTGLLIVPEFFYAKDIYPGHYRANTMFKLGYQAFIMLSIVSGYTIISLRDYVLKLKSSGQNVLYRFLQVFFIFDMAFLILVMIYPYFSIDSYYGAFKDKKLGGRSYEGLDGTVWMTISHLDDYEAILWLKSQAKPDLASRDNPTMASPVILEAVGESYTDYARISSHTGFPTVLGWPVHEWLWRGSYDEPGKRVEEVRQIYEGTDKQSVLSLLNNFNVTYIVIGKLEREKYPNLNEKLLLSLGEKVFESGETAIYKVKY
ncbi:MAG: hypothetical protein UU14_C0048G0002 [Candidatus Roizmanbacteria bacterium GW2011_GWB1_40_7]|uniref:Chlor-arch-YYY domain-containing protein n=3 Tax=Candidatus Roizmaniibacteriota TaxID=1752723 RepID=A0A0G0T6V7_9BACT|nr:MAG: hypothetical protein UU14_C0048G0002 [Candidatus Roizmanbacteria bacterium GW2011_GWB1_40_7]KKR91094.1 MAG: hypothetical protein UU41_C0048G0007 [Candidatus Roizmanbacteria bacterium GW2011_GWA1_41_13]